MSKRIGSPAARPTPAYRRHFIRAWREEAELSLDELVELAREHLESFSKASLSRIETYRQPYSEPIMEALGKALRCEPADLLRAPDDKIWKLVGELKGLDDDALAQVARIAATFRKSP